METSPVGKGIDFYAARSPPQLGPCTIWIWVGANTGGNTTSVKLRVEGVGQVLSPSSAQQGGQIVEEMAGDSEQKEAVLEEGDI